MSADPLRHYDPYFTVDLLPGPPRRGWFAEAGVDWQEWAIGFSLDIGRSGFAGHLWLGPLWASAGIEVGA